MIDGEFMKIKFENGSEINTLDVKNDSKRGCIRGRRLTDKEYREVLFSEQVQAEDRVDKIVKELGL